MLAQVLVRNDNTFKIFLQKSKCKNNLIYLRFFNYFLLCPVYYQNYEYLSTVKLNDYGGYYGNVKLQRYSIPSDVLSAIWRLQVIATASCPPTNLYLYALYKRKMYFTHKILQWSNKQDKSIKNDEINNILKNSND